MSSLDGARVALLEARMSGELSDLVRRYGAPSHVLANELTARGARLEEWCLYEWLLPEDIGPLAALKDHLIDRRVDAIAFTSQIQCRNLFRLAADARKSDELVSVLNDHTIVAAIGPVCAAALRAQGMTPDVLPAHPKMGPLIAALADYVELCDDASD